jgi:hypothetical protein
VDGLSRCLAPDVSAWNMSLRKLAEPQPSTNLKGVLSRCLAPDVSAWNMSLRKLAEPQPSTNLKGV